jgi:hypothetical protein
MRKQNIRACFKEQTLRILSAIHSNGPQTYGDLEHAIESAGSYLDREHIAKLRRDGFIIRELASIEPVGRAIRFEHHGQEPSRACDRSGALDRSAPRRHLCGSHLLQSGDRKGRARRGSRRVTRTELIVYLTRARNQAELTQRSNALGELIEGGLTIFDSNSNLITTRAGARMLLLLPPASS